MTIKRNGRAMGLYGKKMQNKDGHSEKKCRFALELSGNLSPECCAKMLKPGVFKYPGLFCSLNEISKT